MGSFFHFKEWIDWKVQKNYDCLFDLYYSKFPYAYYFRKNNNITQYQIGGNQNNHYITLQILVCTSRTMVFMTTHHFPEKKVFTRKYSNFGQICYKSPIFNELIHSCIDYTCKHTRPIFFCPWWYNHTITCNMHESQATKNFRKINLQKNRYNQEAFQT